MRFYMGKINYFLLAIVICLVVAASGCINQDQGNQSNATNQSGNQTGTNVQGVISVVLNGPGTLIIQQGDTESLAIEADPGLISKITTTVSGNILQITDLNLVANGAVKYRLTLKNLNTVTLNGGSDGQINGFNVNTFTSTLDNGKLNLTGTANQHTLTINGAGEADAKNLTSQTATVTINGAGKATVNVSQTLSAIVNGGGSIFYLGNPQVNKQINGNGQIQQFTG